MMQRALERLVSRRARVALAVAALVACDHPAGAGEGYARIEGVPLDQVTLALSAKSNGADLLVDASFGVPGSSIALLDGEALSIVTPSAGPFDFVPPGADGGYHYVVLARDASPTFDLTLTRGAETRRAPVALPPPFTITVTEAAPPITAVTLAWSPIDDTSRHELRAFGACIAPFRRTLASDTGSFVLQSADLVERGAPCTVTVSLTRTRSGALDGWAAGSNVDVAQTRSVAIEVSP